MSVVVASPFPAARAALGVLEIKQKLRLSRIGALWANGDQRLADGLTKVSPTAAERLIRSCQWG